MIDRVKLALVVVLCAARVALAHPIEADRPQEVPGPVWISGPDKAYNCTHYLDAPSAWNAPPRVKVGEPMKLVMRRDKEMKFALVAKAPDHKVFYELESAPPNAKLTGNKFSWKVAGTPNQKFDFALVAKNINGGKTRWPISVTIADDKMVTAWSAGLGSVWPDCNVYAPMHYEDVSDLDGDGKDDVIYKTYAGDDGTTESHVMLQRGTMKFVEVHTCYSCGPAPDVAVDGTRLLVLQESCCCMETGTIYRFEKDALVAVGSWQEPSPSGCNSDPSTGVTIVLDRDAKNRLEAIEMHVENGKVTRYKWNAKTKAFAP